MSGELEVGKELKVRQDELKVQDHRKIRFQTTHVKHFNVDLAGVVDSERPIRIRSKMLGFVGANH